MSFTAEVTGNWRRKNNALEGVVTPELLSELGEVAVKMLRERMAKGIDVEGRPFQPYSAGWKKARVKRGKASAPVDLNFEGNMLASMKAIVNAAGGEVAISFENGKEAEKANFHNVSGAGSSKVRRVFLGLTESEADVLEELLKSRLAKTAAFS
ncbi:hypothetical protein EPN18_03895 [bacterium]|nr:MAG: hypothetical protein EPN18_03895 [bacterium]